MISLMYITNQPEIALIAEAAGVNRIFVDMEYIGKDQRQGGLDTVQSHHTTEDIRRLSKLLTSAQLLARVNPIHPATKAYCSSKEEIDDAIESGATILMLPYFKNVAEVATFLELVNGRARTIPLVETPQAVRAIDDILRLDGIDEIYVGLNDLSLGYGKKFMFELLCDGTVESLSLKFRQKGIPFGFGGIAALGKGALPAERVIIEHYRLGSTIAILSRSFCNTSLITDMDEIREIFFSGLKEIRAFEAQVAVHGQFFADNLAAVRAGVAAVIGA